MLPLKKLPKPNYNIEIYLDDIDVPERKIIIEINPNVTSENYFEKLHDDIVDQLITKTTQNSNLSKHLSNLNHFYRIAQQLSSQVKIEYG